MERDVVEGVLREEPRENRDQLTLPFDEKPAADPKANIPTVSQLTRRLRGHLEAAFPDVWVRGEVSNFRKPVSGHAYFVLKDATAQMRIVMFRPALVKLRFALQDGMEVLLHGKVAVYEARGEYQLVADTAEPVGAGALQLAFEQLKKKLETEGLFDPRRKRPLPVLPRRIGIITSPTGAAVRDILKVLKRRYPNRECLILPASVQGEKAAGEIASAIEVACRWNTTYPERALDVLIVGRGGGSLEDLWPFNEERVARALAQCPIPTISAVGHEIDFTIADFVADVRAPTPSAAAEIVVPCKDDLVSVVNNLERRLWLALRKKLEQLRLHLGHLQNRLLDPRQKISLFKRDLKRLDERLERAILGQIDRKRRELEAKAAKLHALSPLKVIGRGYCLTRTLTGQLVTRIADTAPGERIESRVSDGIILSEVLSVRPETL